MSMASCILCIVQWSGKSGQKFFYSGWCFLLLFHLLVWLCKRGRGGLGWIRLVVVATQRRIASRRTKARKTFVAEKVKEEKRKKTFSLLVWTDEESFFFPSDFVPRAQGKRATSEENFIESSSARRKRESGGKRTGLCRVKPDRPTYTTCPCNYILHLVHTSLWGGTKNQNNLFRSKFRSTYTISLGAGQGNNSAICSWSQLHQIQNLTHVRCVRCMWDLWDVWYFEFGAIGSDLQIAPTSKYHQSH